MQFEDLELLSVLDIEDGLGQIARETGKQLPLDVIASLARQIVENAGEGVDFHRGVNQGVKAFVGSLH